jgi:hypothetical protein
VVRNLSTPRRFTTGATPRHRTRASRAMSGRAVPLAKAVHQVNFRMAIPSSVRECAAGTSGLRSNDTICSMGSELADFQARQVVQGMNNLRQQVDLFTIHARTLRTSPSLDGLALLQEADRLLQKLRASRGNFITVQAQTGSLSRALSSQPPASGGMPPAAKWGNEFRAGAKQFKESVLKAETEIRQLYNAANLQLNSPTRTPTGAPDNILDILLNFADALARWIEYRRRQVR